MTEEGRVFVAGHRGMLGHVVARLFSEAGWSVHTTEQRFDGRLDGPFLSAVDDARCNVVVNCLAAGPRASDKELLLANAVFPQVLAARCIGALTIHASSDGVFSGERGDYVLGEPPDATDSYGISKRLGERCVELGRTVALRVSIVGPDLNKPRNLMSWYLSQGQRRVHGFTDVRWNGITTLQWARLALAAARGEIAPGIHQPASPEVLSKAELLSAIKTAFGGTAEIEPVACGSPIDRSLRPTLEVPPIASQFGELSRWYGS